MTSMPILSWGSSPPEDLRKAYAEDRAAIRDTCHPDVVQTKLDTITGASLRFDPPGASGTKILYFHGGGWVAGSPDTHVTLCSWMAATTGRTILSVPYTLCPEAKFPSQYHQAAQALDDFLRTEPQAIVMGDSAGGAMALWAEAGAVHRDRVAAVVSLYGAFGAVGTDSMATFGPESGGLDDASVLGMYARLGCDAGQGIAQAAAAKGAPGLLVTAGTDPLGDDHAWLQSQKPDRSFENITIPDRPHAFLQMAGTDEVARDAMQQISDWLLKTAA